MRLISLKITGFKNLNIWDEPIDFSASNWISVFVGSNWSWKSNILEAISAIFAGIYDAKYRPACDYEIKYQIHWTEIQVIQKYYKWSGPIELNGTVIPIWPEGELRLVGFYVNGKYTKNLDKKFFPSQVIALYSWEETRLYDQYYLPTYDAFIKSIITSKTGVSEDVRMTYINKDFWNIALLTMAVSDIPLEKILGNVKVDTIEFEFNRKNLEGFNKKNPNEVTRFALWISEIENLNLEKFKMMPLIRTHKDLYKLLSVAYLPKEETYRLVNSIDLYFDNWVSASCLSEGQKKQILIYFVTQILADKDSIIILDEPDSYIHVGNKQKIKEFFADFLDITKEGDFILTTHSPTLMHKFDKNHLFYLENGKLNWKEKRWILNQITDGQMSMNEMEVFLNSDKKYLLATEGKTDKKHLETAIEKIWLKNDYDIYSCDWADKLKQFLVWLPKGFFKNKVVIWIFDYDKEWLKQIKQIWDPIEENKRYKVCERDGVFGITLPCPNQNFEIHENCPIEFLYPKALLENNGMITKRGLGEVNYYFKRDEDKLNFEELKEKTELFFYKISESDSSKNSFSEKVKDLNSDEFEAFGKLFSIIQSFT